MVKGGQNDPLNAVKAADQALPVLRRIDEVHRLTGDHLLGRPVKGENHRLRAQLAGTLHCFLQQRAVAAVYAIEKAQGYHSSFQNVHAPKKFFCEVRTPCAMRLRHKNVPSRPYTRYSPSASPFTSRGLPHRQRRSASSEATV